jgi:hypothetical protein
MIIDFDLKPICIDEVTTDCLVADSTGCMICADGLVSMFSNINNIYECRPILPECGDGEILNMSMSTVDGNSVINRMECISEANCVDPIRFASDPSIEERLSWLTTQSLTEEYFTLSTNFLYEDDANYRYCGCVGHNQIFDKEFGNCMVPMVKSPTMIDSIYDDEKFINKSCAEKHGETEDCKQCKDQDILIFGEKPSFNDVCG